MGGLIIRLLGLFWIVFGISGLVATKKTTQALCNWVKSTRRQTLGLISLIVGVLLVLSASSAREVWFVLALGIMSCLKGASTILTTEQKLKAVIDWWLSGPEIVHKGWASFILVLGVVMFYIV